MVSSGSHWRSCDGFGHDFSMFLGWRLIGIVCICWWWKILDLLQRVLLELQLPLEGPFLAVRNRRSGKEDRVSNRLHSVLS